MLSVMQQKIYDYIAACIQRQGYPPSVREIGEAVGLRSPSTVHFHLKKLVDAGAIEIGAGKGRAITLTHPAVSVPPVPENPAGRVPIVGNVAAGSPILAQARAASMPAWPAPMTATSNSPASYRVIALSRPPGRRRG